MNPLKMVTILLAASVLVATVYPQREVAAPKPAAVAPSEFEHYAAREAATPQLAQFEGGFHEVILFFVLIGVIFCCVDWIFIDPWCEECHMHHRHVHRVPPPHPGGPVSP